MQKRAIIAIILFLLPMRLYAGNVRFGPFIHNLDHLSQKHEKGFNFSIEYLASRNNQILYGRPLMGISLNILGYTSNLYGGLLWQVPLAYNTHLELGFGVSLNNAELKDKNKSKQASGSNILFRESIGLKYQYLPQLGFILQLEHRSNANIRRPNPGFTNLGVMFEVDL